MSSSPFLVSSLPSTTFSATVNTGISWKCWCTMPMPCGDRVLHALSKSTSSPRTSIVPASGW